jgi:hypothetical protein
MEIEFNPGRIGKPDPSVPAGRPAAPRAAAADPSFAEVKSLEARLRELPMVRREKVERALSLASDVKYPPDEVLVGIANLLAMHLP